MPVIPIDKGQFCFADGKRQGSRSGRKEQRAVTVREVAGTATEPRVSNVRAGREILERNKEQRAQQSWAMQAICDAVAAQKRPALSPKGKGGLPLSDCFVALRSQTTGMLVRRISHSSQIQASNGDITYVWLSNERHLSSRERDRRVNSSKNVTQVVVVMPLSLFASFSLCG